VRKQVAKTTVEKSKKKGGGQAVIQGGVGVQAKGLKTSLYERKIRLTAKCA
jgi:hypothetical protein